MTILAIDPSINNTGWAVLGTCRILDAGATVARMPCHAVAHGVWRPKDEDPYDRLIELCDSLDSAIEEYRPRVIVIETTSGHVSSRHGGGGANLSLFGVAVGGLVVEARALFAVQVGPGREGFSISLVTENLWTGGQPKRSTAKRTGRHEQTLAEFGLPKRTSDHETDAIALGAWWYANRKMLEKTA